MNNVGQISSFIRRAVPNWYTYKYDEPHSAYEIRDGGHDMFDKGNHVCLCYLFKVIVVVCISDAAGQVFGLKE